LFNISFIGVIGGIVKSTVNQPRPWVLDPDVHPVPEAQATARGGSLPSSHSTAAMASYGSAAWASEIKALKALFLLVAIIIPFSRMFLGVHTPLDIIAALAIVLAVAFVNYRVLSWSHESERNRLYVLVGYIIAAAVLDIICDVRSGRLFSNSGALMCLAIPVCLLIEERFVGYEPPEAIRDRVLIALPGLVLMLVLALVVNSFRFAIPGIGNVLLMFFLILVYPYLLKMYLERA
jgi:undecaprenyl-diphosphatase